MNNKFMMKYKTEKISESELEKFKTILINSENTLDKLHPHDYYYYDNDIDHPIKEDKVISHYNRGFHSKTEFVKMIDEKTDIKSVYKDIISATNLSTVNKLEIFIGISWLNQHKNGAFIPYECELQDDHRRIGGAREEDCLFQQFFEPMERSITRNYVNAREIQLKCKINKWLDSLEFDYHSMMIRADNARPCYGDCNPFSGSYEDPFEEVIPDCRGSACDTDGGGRYNTPWKPVAVHMMMTIGYNIDESSINDDSDIE